jgi:tetratricopeptide (TPR) repeat protein
VFFPYVGLTASAVALVAAAVAGRPGLRRAAGVAAVAVIAAHAYGTHARNRVWHDGLALWRDVSEKSPRNGRGLMNYGVALLGRGQLRQALEQFERAEALVPDYGILQINLAIAKDAAGEPGAERHFRRALELDPGYARGRYHYALWLVEQGRAPEALQQLEVSLAASPGDLEARALMARLLAAGGEEARLAEFARQSLAIAPADAVSALLAAPTDTAEFYAALARKHGAAGDWLAAAGAARRAVRVAPESAAAWNDLGWSRLELGFAGQAVECFERALALDPGSDRARANLGLARRRLPAQSPGDRAP